MLIPTGVMLSLLLRSFMDNYKPLPPERQYFARIELHDKSDEEIEGYFTEIWNPDNFKDFDGGDFYVQKGEQIAAHIDPAYAKLVA